jgi:hypothetical protein
LNTANLSPTGLYWSNGYINLDLDKSCQFGVIEINSIILGFLMLCRIPLLNESRSLITLRAIDCRCANIQLDSSGSEHAADTVEHAKDSWLVRELDLAAEYPYLPLFVHVGGKRIHEIQLRLRIYIISIDGEAAPSLGVAVLRNR